MPRNSTPAKTRFARNSRPPWPTLAAFGPPKAGARRTAPLTEDLLSKTTPESPQGSTLACTAELGGYERNYQALRRKPKLNFEAISGSFLKANPQSVVRPVGLLLWGAQEQLKSATGAESCAQNGFLQGCCSGAILGGQTPVNGSGPLGADLGRQASANIAHWPRRLLATFGALRGITAAAWHPKSAPNGSPQLTVACPLKSGPKMAPRLPQ